MYNSSIFISSFTYYPFEYYLLLFAGPSIYSITGGTGRLGLINIKESSEMRTALLLTHSPYCSAARCSHSALIQTANTRQRTSSHQPSHRRYWLRLHQTYKYINRKQILQFAILQYIPTNSCIWYLYRTMKIMKWLSLINSSINKACKQRRASGFGFIL